jgi:AraC-like DNA-binding protein
MNEINDFASAVMVRVLVHGMRDLGLDPGESPAPAASARVDLSLKRRLLEHAVAQGGMACLPLLGRGVSHLRHEPTHAALTAEAGPPGVVSRWQRLERYVHSRHRCVVTAQEAFTMTMAHRSVVAGEAPSAPEDLVVLGVLAALMSEAGTEGLEVRISGVPVWPQPDPQGLRRLVRRQACGTWTWRWQGVRAAHAVGSAPSPELPADDAWPPTAHAVWRCLTSDLTHPWRGPDIAERLGMPWRSVQRRLAAAGLSLTALQAEARCRSGAWRLLNTTEPVAQVGFLSGFSDQPHFTRALRQRVGLTPAAYRAAFAVPGATG